MSEIIAIVRVVLKRRDGRILLLKRSKYSCHNPSRWEFPGGGMGLSEGLTEALRREIREETGLDMASGLPISFVSVGAWEPQPWPQSGSRTELYGGDPCMISDGEEIGLSPDHEDFGFFTVDEARSHSLTPSAKAALSNRWLCPMARR